MKPVFLSKTKIKKGKKGEKKPGEICVKTSTGLDPKIDIDTKVLHVKLMREAVGRDFLIKAAGGIKTIEDAKKMIEAGADIIGTSSSLKILGISREGGNY